MTDEKYNRIESDPAILSGKPCLKGSRIPVALILGYCAAEKTTEEIIKQFPNLTVEDIAASLNYSHA